MSFERGCVVRSMAGRDKDRLLAVTKVLPNGIEVCDGKERKLQKPKIKNPKHIEQTRFTVTEEELAFNGRLRKALNRIQDDTASL